MDSGVPGLAGGPVTAREVLDGIKGRLGAATPGPWAHYGDLGHEIYPIHGEEPETVAGEVPRVADATFMAAAPVDVARLTRAVEAVLELADTWQQDFPYKADQLRSAIENALNP